MRGVAEMKFTLVVCFTKCIYTLHDGSLVILSRFNFSSCTPVCLVQFGEENGEIIDVYVKFRINKMIKEMKKMKKWKK